MTRSEILKAAHAAAKRDRRLYPSYREALADGIKAVHAGLRSAPVTTGFQIVEPWYKRQMWCPRRPAGWVAL